MTWTPPYNPNPDYQEPYQPNPWGWGPMPPGWTPPAPPLPVIITTPFLSGTDLNTAVYAEVIAAISDGDTTLFPQAVNAATNEAMGYMSRYDYVTILSQAGALRDPILLLYLKDIAVWHFMVLANPNLDWEVRLERYKMAIRWLEKIQDGRFVPAGWPPAPVSTSSTEFHVMATQDKRCNNY